jgi:hypothetical protein
MDSPTLHGCHLWPIDLDWPSRDGQNQDVDVGHFETFGAHYSTTCYFSHFGMHSIAYHHRVFFPPARQSTLALSCPCIDLRQRQYFVLCWSYKSTNTTTDSNNMLGPVLRQMNYWLCYSLQQDGQEELSFFLTLNYQGHVSFFMVPSALFYSNQLQRAGYKEMMGDQLEDEDTQWCERLHSVETLSEPFRLPPSTTGIANLGVPPDWVGQQKQFNWPIHFCGIIGKDTSASIESGFSTDLWSNMERSRDGDTNDCHPCLGAKSARSEDWHYRTLSGSSPRIDSSLKCLACMGLPEQLHV